MKKYKFRYSKTSLVLFLIGFIVATALLIINAIKLGQDVHKENTASYLISVIIAIVFIALVISAFFYSFYTVENQNVILHIAFMKSKIPLADVTKVLHVTDQHKLYLLLQDDKFMTVSIDENLFEQFFDDAKKQNKILKFKATTADELE